MIGIKVFAPGGVVYGATKAAVRILSERPRMEMKPHNISPGAVFSELPDSVTDGGRQERPRFL